MNSNQNSILLVNDNVDNLYLLQQILKPGAYAISCVQSGEEALEVVHLQLPDLILLDVRMSGIDGFETLRRLKDSKPTQSVPVVFVTGRTLPEEVERFFSMEAVDYMAKPYSQGEVRHRVKIHLMLRECCQEGFVSLALSLQGSTASIPTLQDHPATREFSQVNLEDEAMFDLTKNYLRGLKEEMPVLEDALQRGFFHNNQDGTSLLRLGSELWVHLPQAHGTVFGICRRAEIGNYRDGTHRFAHRLSQSSSN
ncbi:MAG: response regulator [Nitrospinae bacterium]|nr:response regulator [Nitrospinota bacterium]MBL7021500.1 response regulator [Nitrospinaceae bacterium]